MVSIDQIGTQIELKEPPQRIISLVPSQTDLLHYLGLEQEVVGITKFCVHPEEWFRTKTRIGGTKKVKHELIHSLKPDLIIGNKEENTREDIERLKQEFPVWVSDILTIADALKMIEEVGKITGKIAPAQNLVSDIRKEITEIKATDRSLRVAYLIWKEPLMAVGADTYIHDFLESTGFTNALGHLSRYPEIQLEDLKALDLDAVLLSSEPYPFKNKHKSIFTDVVPIEHVHIVDGEAFSWYGHRMLKGIQYARALHRSLHIHS